VNVLIGLTVEGGSVPTTSVTNDVHVGEGILRRVKKNSGTRIHVLSLRRCRRSVVRGHGSSRTSRSHNVGRSLGLSGDTGRRQINATTTTLSTTRTSKTVVGNVGTSVGTSVVTDVRTATLTVREEQTNGLSVLQRASHLLNVVWLRERLFVARARIRIAEEKLGRC
jgi:hypothetical protein